MKTYMLKILFHRLLIYCNFTSNSEEFLICTQMLYCFFICSPALKAYLSISDRLSSVRSFVRPSVCKLSTFSSFPELQAPFQPNLAQSILGLREIQVCSNEGPHPFPRGDNYEIAKIHWRNWIFFRTTGQISTKLGINHPWLKRAQGFTNKDHSILKGDSDFFSSP